tara:strand:+ start:425 stop:580 length:156 start_codon:yes stop_codon:yes gene_type:complete
MKNFKYTCLTLLNFFEGEIMCENIEKCKIELQKKYHTVIKVEEVKQEINKL